MKKLEEIPKKEVFTTPEGYFDKLPTIIQSRIAGESKKAFILSFQGSLKYAFPVVVLLAVGVFWFLRPAKQTDAELILASVQTEDLVAYLTESEISTEEVLEFVEFNAADLDEIESEVYNLDELDLEDLDLENLVNEMDENNL